MLEFIVLVIFAIFIILWLYYENVTLQDEISRLNIEIEKLKIVDEYIPK